MSIYEAMTLNELHIAFDAAVGQYDYLTTIINEPRVYTVPDWMDAECGRLSTMLHEIDEEAARRVPVYESEVEDQAAICLGRALEFPEYSGEWRA
jgi:uncharacterized protein YjaG (DUF416 family)